MVQNTDEFDIGTLWEQRIVFDLRPLRRRIDRIGIFDEEDTMGVADANRMEHIYTSFFYFFIIHSSVSFKNP